MKNEFTKGFAFILEGATEKEFYLSFLFYLCKKYGCELNRIVDETCPDIVYHLVAKNTTFLLKFNVVNTITQMPRAGNWFNSQCVAKYSRGHDWTVFLCYDKDNYKDDISKFYEGDWAILRQTLKKAKIIIDVAAAADIEDVMLSDLKSICSYLGSDLPGSLRGANGKQKMKNLFRDCGQTYHEGVRARPLIEALDMETLISANIVPLKDIEQLIFK